MRCATPAPVDDGARERAWRVVPGGLRRARAEPAPRRRPRRRLVALAVALALVPVAAGRRRRRQRAGQRRRASGCGACSGSASATPQPALVHVPGGGRLLVQGGDGAWVVFADGAKRRLGGYAGAAWSPHGRFVIAWQGSELTALDPGGRVRWSLARAGRVDMARWAPVDGFRIAYLAGDELRVVNGDGTGDRRFAAARRDVAPAWRPDDAHVARLRRRARPRQRRRGRLAAGACGAARRYAARSR